MPAGSQVNHPTASDSSVAAAVPANNAAPTDAGHAALPPQVALPSSAHRAVEAVMGTVDRFSGREQHSVNLQFSVAGSDLSVRVEMRAGQVQATFRTDSPELRDALSAEWQAVNAQPSGDRTTRMAPPVFTSASPGGNSFSGDGAPRQHDSSRQPGQSFPGTGTPSRSTRAGASAPVAPASTSRIVSGNSLHLSTLA